MFQISRVVSLLLLIFSVYAENGNIVNIILARFFAMYLQFVMFIALAIIIGYANNILLLLVWIYLEALLIKNYAP